MFQHHPVSRCDFIYNTTNGYTQFRLVEREDWYIGFRRKRSKQKNRVKGKPLPGYKKTVKRFEMCYDFTLEPLHPVPTIYSPIDFNKLGPTYEPGKPLHKIRHMKKYEDISHRKVRRRRKHKIKRKSKRKQPGR